MGRVKFEEEDFDKIAETLKVMIGALEDMQHPYYCYSCGTDFMKRPSGTPPHKEDCMLMKAITESLWLYDKYLEYE